MKDKIFVVEYKDKDTIVPLSYHNTKKSAQGALEQLGVERQAVALFTVITEMQADSSGRFIRVKSERPMCDNKLEILINKTNK